MWNRVFPSNCRAGRGFGGAMARTEPDSDQLGTVSTSPKDAQRGGRGGRGGLDHVDTFRRGLQADQDGSAGARHVAEYTDSETDRDQHRRNHKGELIISNSYFACLTSITSR